MTAISYFDLASEYYMAYLLEGLLDEAPLFKCKLSIRKTLPPLLRGGGRFNSFDAEKLLAIGLFKLEENGKESWFCVDCLDDSGPRGYLRPLLETVDYYFKLNCNQAAFVQDKSLLPFKSKVHSLPCTFAVRPSKPWLFVPRLIPCYEYRWNWFSIRRRIRALQRVPSMRWHLKLRHSPRNHDVFLTRRYYSHPEHAESNELYYRLFESAKEHGLTGVMGFTGRRGEIPQRFQQYYIGPDRTQRDHLSLIAASRACVYLPGTYNCLSFKFGQYLALGKPTIGLKLPFWPATGMNEGDRNILKDQFSCNTPEEIPPRLVELLRSPRQMASLCSNNIRIYDKHFSPGAVGRHILGIVLHSS